MVLLVLFATSHTNIDPLQVLSTMAPKQDRIYARRRSKSVAPSARMVIGSDDERDPEYEAPSVDPAEDTVLAALFATSEILSPPPREHAKRHRG